MGNNSNNKTKLKEKRINVTGLIVFISLILFFTWFFIYALKDGEEKINTQSKNNSSSNSPQTQTNNYDDTIDKILSDQSSTENKTNDTKVYLDYKETLEPIILEFTSAGETFSYVGDYLQAGLSNKAMQDTDEAEKSMRNVREQIDLLTPPENLVEANKNLSKGAEKFALAFMKFKDFIVTQNEKSFEESFSLLQDGRMLFYQAIKDIQEKYNEIGIDFE